MQRYNNNLKPIIKWAGGKENELEHILSNMPSSFENYYEPFVGGGSVFTAISADAYYINDKSEELVNLYRCVSKEDEKFFYWIEKISSIWDNCFQQTKELKEIASIYKHYRESPTESLLNELLFFVKKDKLSLQKKLCNEINYDIDFYSSEISHVLLRKFSRMRKIEKTRTLMPDEDVFENIATAFMGTLYTYFRKLYNDKSYLNRYDGLETALFVFIRNYAYSGMFRYNKKGDFNVPFGGIAYNGKSLSKKISYYKSDALISLLRKTQISNLDFEEFLKKYIPNKNDFIFLDPPYDTEFSTYAKNEFRKEDHVRLANFLCNNCRSKWMLIIKNTPLIVSLYGEKKLNIKSFDKKYKVSFMNRNNKNAEHLIITNY